MEQIRQLEELKSLNRAFQKAFSHAEARETMEDLLACIGEELTCRRISIFEARLDGTCDNTHEWCPPGVDRVRELMRALPAEPMDRWMRALRQQEYLRVGDVDALRATLPEIHALYAGRGVKSLVASRLAFHGQEIGFFVIEDPAEELLCDASIVMPGMRYILSSMVYHEHLVRRMESINQRDKLTGAGNLSSMQEQMRRWPKDAPIGVCYVEVLGWTAGHAAPAALQTEQALIRAGEALIGLFGQGCVFRAAANEFLVLWDGRLVTFGRKTARVRNLFKEHDLLCGVGFASRERLDDEMENLIHQVHLAAHEDSRQLTAEGAAKRDATADAEGGLGHAKADISLARSDAFFALAEDYVQRRQGGTVMIGVIDLNYFKLYNDIFGREAGSRFLEAIAGDLDAQTRRHQGLCGYLGGDNFIFLLPLESDDAAAHQAVAESVYRGLSYPDGFSPAVGVYVSVPGDPVTAMYDHALTALQEIKGSYVERIRFYDLDRYLQDRDDKLLLMDIREGIENDEFMFYLQPQVHEKTGQVVGAEALCRWKHKGSLIDPGRFIPTLEKTGTIFEVDCIIWEKACQWLKSVKDRGLPRLPISVNVSRIDFFFTDIAEYFIGLAKKYDVEPELLGIEITESAFADNMELLMGAVEKLHAAGFHILMDDFGSGYSSLSMLHSMNLDVLKTDVRFMSRSQADVKAFSIVESVVSMAHMIGMIVITEGIETESQRENLIAMGENYAQGFLFYRPMPVEQFENLLTQPELLGAPYQSSSPEIHNQLHFREMVHSGVLSGPLLDNLIGPAAVLKRETGRLTFMQANEQCKALAGLHDGLEGAAAFLGANGAFFDDVLERANLHPGEGVTGAVTGCAGEALSARVFMLYSCEDHELYFMTMNPV